METWLMNEQIVQPKYKALKEWTEPQMSDFLIHILIYLLIIGHTGQWNCCFIALSYKIWSATNPIQLHWRTKTLIYLLHFLEPCKWEKNYFLNSEGYEKYCFPWYFMIIHLIRCGADRARVRLSFFQGLLSEQPTHSLGISTKTNP